MTANAETSRTPDDRLSVEKRSDGTLVVTVRSTNRLPDARFSFRCGEPQYAYWLSRYEEHLAAAR